VKTNVYFINKKSKKIAEAKNLIKIKKFNPKNNLALLFFFISAN